MFRLHYLAAAVLFTLVCSVQLQEEKFAGNLIPDSDQAADDDGSSERTSSVGEKNFTEDTEGVDVVPSAPERVDPLPQKRPVKKAAPPPGKPESVGFVPPSEEDEKGSSSKEENIEPVSGESQVVTSIPTLPPSIIKPGRMSNGSWYIVLYASWCAHSRAALAEFLQTVQYIVDHNITEIVVGKIDIVKHSDVAKHFRVKATPTIFFFKNGVRYTFDHPVVSSANLVEFMLDALKATVSHVADSSELAALKKNHSVLFMIVHDQEIDVDWQRIYIKQANDKALKAKFAVTTNPDVVEDLELRTLPAILVFKDHTFFKFRESLTAHSLSKWILVEKDEAFPIVNTSTFRKYIHPVSGRRLALLVVNEDPNLRTASEKQAIEDVQTLAYNRKQHHKFQFGLVEGRSIPEMFMQRSVESFPYLLALEPYTGYYFILQPGGKRGAMSKKVISNFLRRIISGEEDRFGGITYLDQLQYFYQLVYGTFQSMIVHKPILSMTAGLCVVGVMCFYIVICWQGDTNKLSPAEIRTRKIARTRRRKEEMEKRAAEDTRRRIDAKEMAVAKARDEMGVRQRRNRDVELDTVQNGTDGGSGTETESETDSDHSSTQSEDNSQAER